MKVRWMHGSLRLRISPDELSSLLCHGEVVESLGAPGRGSWTVTCAGGEQSDLVIDGGAVLFTIAAADLARLAAEEVEGVYFATDTDPPFRYYIEKNFPCAHPHPPEAAAMDSPSETFRPTAAFEERKRRHRK